ncbi:MAG: hypothetical protein JEY91_18250 [Spirochaetaceae bacterium]|nr:hypothetical protein [Spirochaetaceae bacterium]
MSKKRLLTIALVLSFSIHSLIAQMDSYLMEEEIENSINLALDYFSSGQYEQALMTLENVLAIDPVNKRAIDLRTSILELYNIEYNTSEDKGTGEADVTEKPNFTTNDSEEENGDENLEKPDFSVREEDSQLVQSEDTRTAFELSLSPNLVLPWSISEESVVFPSESGRSVSFNIEADYYFPAWDRILGLSGVYSLFLLDPEDQGFASSQLHVIDVMIDFRTFFMETPDSKIIFKLGLGYRGYFSRGYEFYSIDLDSLNGFNMGVNIEAPLLFLFWDREALKRLIFDVDINLLFFPKISTLNLFDFKITSELQFKYFSAGIHFGAYSVITPVDVEYIWMTGLSFRFRL